jgi:hypothetical protein
MTEFILNPRRSPRIAVRCGARIAFRSGNFVASSTIDMGAGGCRVEATGRVATGEQALVELRDANVFGAHLLSGRVVWSSDAAPWRCGIAFDRGSARVAAALFDQMRAAYPDAARKASGVEKIPARALVTPVPIAGRAALAPAEVEVLRALGKGVELGALRDRLGKRWTQCIHALFALVERRVVEVGGRERPAP